MTSSDILATEPTGPNDCVRINSELERKQEDAWERDRLGDRRVDGKITLRWIFRKWDVGVWTGSSWLRIGTFGGQL
jgi:hypothetical protein